LNPGTWIYWKAYVGPPQRTERFICDALPELAATAHPEAWFFIRYRDEGGTHVRVRVLARPESSAEVAEVTRAILERHLTRLPDREPLRYRPAVVPPQAWNGGNVESAARLERATYAPDVDTFGPEGVRTAERLSATSSALALTILTEEHAGGFSRKVFAPLLMEIAASAMGVGDESFWRSYVAHWLGNEEKFIALWTPIFEAKAQKLRDAGRSIRKAPASFTQREADHLEAWREAMRIAAMEHGRLAPVENRSIVWLALNHIHLMNNRLGLNVLEEAYFGTLIQREA
jgi:thiopeptide-type bacteriocin biosynthesis protein